MLRDRALSSALAPQLRAFVAFKRQLGVSGYGRAQAVKEFDDFLIARGIHKAEQISTGLIINWLQSKPHQAASTKNKKLLFARGFLGHLARTGVFHKNLALDIPHFKLKPFSPHIYTLREIHQLLEEARDQQRRHPFILTGSTMETMLLLLYACGLRLSEAINLRIQDVEFEQGILTLWRTKFDKERVVPFSSEVGAKLRAYLARRKARYPGASSEDPFFCHARGKYTKVGVEVNFHLYRARSGLYKAPGRGGPRLHDFRHTFAVHRLYKWYQEGHNILNKLPLLTTFMGHSEVKNTQVYLTITRELLREGDRRFQASFEEVTAKPLSRACTKS